MDPNWSESLRKKLDQYYSWPSLYTFKFIVPADKVEDVKKLFPLHESTEKKSNKGNYISVTFNMMMPGSDAVIAVYEQVSVIEGILAL
jgi:hypothetical protein